METKIKWNEGDGYITATYEGSGSGSASISSDVNEGIDREQSIKVETTDKSKSASILVQQEGLREVFLTSDGDFVLADGGTFNVIKGDGDSMFPATIVYSYNKENTNNADVVMYLLEKYPDMPTTDSRYTPISEQIEIVGSEECDGVVIGVSKWSDTTVLLFTEESFANYYGFRVSSHGDPSYPAGSTVDWFTD